MDDTASANAQKDDPIATAIAFVAAQPDGPERILRLHASDDVEHCTTCGVGVVAVTWPCWTAQIALAAKRSVPARLH